MGRPSNPVATENTTLAVLATQLRMYLGYAGLTYAALAEITDVSRVTLQRAASGKNVPKEKTIVAFATGCGRSHEELAGLLRLRIEARIEARGVLGTLRAPNPKLISDQRDLSRALEYVYELAGAPSLREIQEKSGEPLALPISTISRIVSRQTTPVDERQLLAFIHGCGITDQDAMWSEVWTAVNERMHLVADSPEGVFATVSRATLSRYLPGRDPLARDDVSEELLRELASYVTTLTTSHQLTPRDHVRLGRILRRFSRQQYMR
ncbi:helix-turn-helix domain-containing protein [Streptomyces sp. NPDC093065]|uniref:helix-turn-helix domain-containing protein n=1 Tax=Streptomyces sp. NPDC093065 TaxID=3366021 RepID=UPI00382B2895